MGAELLLRARSRAPDVTEILGERLGRSLAPGALLALVGDLGSGKTTLTRGLARGLGVREPIVSPTFTRMRVLPGRLTLYHFDAWRGGAEDLFAEGSEFLAGDGVAVVEWADRVESSLPRPRLLIELRSIEETTRELRASLVPCSEGAKGRALELAGSLRRAVAELGALSGLEHMSRP